MVHILETLETGPGLLFLRKQGLRFARRDSSASPGAAFNASTGTADGDGSYVCRAAAARIPAFLLA
jgi:hypothetical protein